MTPSRRGPLAARRHPLEAGRLVGEVLDIPALGSVQVAAAFRALGRRPWVLGPAADGGYWLVGARRRPALRLPFEGVRWSSRHALADTLARLDGPAELLEVLSDVDEANELARAPAATVLRSVRRPHAGISRPPADAP